MTLPAVWPLAVGGLVALGSADSYVLLCSFWTKCDCDTKL